MSHAPHLPLKIALLVSLSLTALWPALAEDEYSLKLRWLPGHVYTQETLTETATGLTAIGKPEDQKMKVKQTTVIRVTADEGGKKLARVTFQALTGEVMLQGEKQTFDSANLTMASPMIRASVGQSVGKSFILVYSPEDRFVEVRDSGAMASSADGIPALDGIAEAKEVAELYRRSLEMGLPKMTVKLGDRWTSQETVKFPSAGTVTVELRAKLDTILEYEGRSHAKVSFEGEMKSADESVGTRNVTLGAGSKTFGQVLFDLERGTVSFGAFRADIKLQINGKIVPVRQQVTTRLTSLVKE